MAQTKKQIADAAAKTQAVLSKHVQELAGHTIDNALAVGHGHMVGSQGPKGHTMVPSDAHLQSDGYIPQACARNISTKAGGAGFDDPSQGDYGMIDTDTSES